MKQLTLDEMKQYEDKLEFFYEECLNSCDFYGGFSSSYFMKQRISMIAVLKILNELQVFPSKKDLFLSEMDLSDGISYYYTNCEMIGNDFSTIAYEVYAACGWEKDEYDICEMVENFFEEVMDMEIDIYNDMPSFELTNELWEKKAETYFMESMFINTYEFYKDILRSVFIRFCNAEITGYFGIFKNKKLGEYLTHNPDGSELDTYIRHLVEFIEQPLALYIPEIHRSGVDSRDGCFKFNIIEIIAYDTADSSGWANYMACNLVRLVLLSMALRLAEK